MLEHVWIGKGLKTMEYGVFDNCYKLREITVDADNPNDFSSEYSQLVKKRTAKNWRAVWSIACTRRR